MANNKVRKPKRSKGTQSSASQALRLSGSKVQIPGIRVTGDGAVGFSADTLPASSHFFDSTHYVVNASGENFVMLFGQKSVFSKENKYNLAVEIAMPRYYANAFLCKAIFDIPSIGEEARPFIESVNDNYNNLEVKDSSEISEFLELPQDNNSFRRFSANYVTVSLSGGQALIEFFEVPPDLLVSVVHNRDIRSGAGAQSVISILTNVSVLKSFLDTVKKNFQ